MTPRQQHSGLCLVYVTFCMLYIISENDAIDLIQNANCNVCALFTLPIKVTPMSSVWKLTTSCSTGPSDVLAPPVMSKSPCSD